MGQNIILALVTAVVAATAAGAIQAKRAFDDVQKEGVTVEIFGAQTKLVPSKSTGRTLILPASAESKISNLPLVAVGAGCAAMVVVLIVGRK